MPFFAVFFLPAVAPVCFFFADTPFFEEVFAVAEAVVLPVADPGAGTATASKMAVIIIIENLFICQG